MFGISIVAELALRMGRASPATATTKEEADRGMAAMIESKQPLVKLPSGSYPCQLKRRRVLKGHFGQVSCSPSFLPSLTSHAPIRIYIPSIFMSYLRILFNLLYMGIDG
jgi:hypothetical protein